jgi:hypothetical protein
MKKQPTTVHLLVVFSFDTKMHGEIKVKKKLRWIVNDQSDRIS